MHRHLQKLAKHSAYISAQQTLVEMRIFKEYAKCLLTHSDTTRCARTHGARASWRFLILSTLLDEWHMRGTKERKGEWEDEAGNGRHRWQATAGGGSTHLSTC